MVTNYKTETFDKEHRHFGGEIYLSDFNTDHRCHSNKKGSIAKRIANDLKLEKNSYDNIKKTVGGN